jgi:hypothetical protein
MTHPKDSRAEPLLAGRRILISGIMEPESAPFGRSRKVSRRGRVARKVRGRFAEFSGRREGAGTTWVIFGALV